MINHRRDHAHGSRVGSTVPNNKRAFLAWVVYRISLAEGHDAVLFKRKSSAENKTLGGPWLVSSILSVFNLSVDSVLCQRFPLDGVFLILIRFSYCFLCISKNNTQDVSHFGMVKLTISVEVRYK